ncbi:radical SAM protein [Candidatus Dojkabacteria bacterium]|nr:radical SAM protein [Candidatus Dojkabacteria bacterium]
MVVNSLTRLIREFLIGHKQPLAFSKADKDNITLPLIKKIGIYIHIPFCKSMCPYCPYNRIRYKKELVKPYLDAILKEVDLYSEKMGRIKISSIYIGGGTPTNLIDELGIIIKRIKSRFNVTGDICIETSVSDITSSIVRKLQSYGVTLISLGVQSFKEESLKFLKRNYHVKDIPKTIGIIKSGNFKSLNIDLMFALPSQKLSDVISDLEEAVELSVDQITTYPLFTFPYSSVGRYKKT